MVRAIKKTTRVSYEVTSMKETGTLGCKASRAASWGSTGTKWCDATLGSQRRSSCVSGALCRLWNHRAISREMRTSNDTVDDALEPATQIR